MARIFKEQAYAEKRNEILASAQRLVFSKGYERMTIQDILADLHISNGAFYHYFDSKPAVLEALVEQIQQEAEQPLLPIVQDPHLPALEKMQRFFATLDSSRITQKIFIAQLARVWFADENAIVREKIAEAILNRRAPLLNTIVRQGIQEGVFATPYPDQAGEIILALGRGMGDALTHLMLAFEQQPDQAHQIEKMVDTYAAYAGAIECILGVTSAFLYRPDAEVFRAWLEVKEGKEL